MNPLFAIDYCRIVAPERLSDRFLASGIIQSPASEESPSSVFLAYVFEITKPWFSSSQVLPSLLEQLNAGYESLKPDKTLGDSFEALLKNINERLNAISESGETDWIGNFNGLIMVMGGDELHFSQTGRCPAYLLQNNRIRQITDESGQEREPHPLKTFSNLASGVLHENDYILLSNHELYNEISLDALRRVINNNTPAASCQSITKELKREKNLAVSSIIAKVLPSSASLESSEPKEIILEEEMQSAFKKFQKKAAPILEAFKHHSIKAGSAGLEASKQAGLAVKTTVAPAATAMLQKGAENASALRKNLADKKKTGKAPVVEIILPKAKQQALSEASETVASIIPADELALSSAQEPTIENTSSTPKIQVSATGLLTSFREWLKDPKHKKVAILGLAVFLLAFSGLTAYIRRQPDTLTPASSQNEEQLTKAQNLYDQAVTARELKQNVEAARHIQDGQQIVNSLTNLNETQKRQAEDIWNKLTTEGDTLTSTTRFAASAGTFSLGKTGQRMFANLPYFFSTLSTPSSSLLRSGKGDPSSTKGTIELPDKDDAIVSIAKSSESDTTGYVLTRNNKVYRIVQSGTDTLLRPITPASGTIAPGDDIATYIGNVYVLDGKTGLLWKYTNTGTAYSKGTSVIDGTKYDIKKSLSLAIDGSIYILKQDATVQKFTGGAQDSFSLKGIPAPGETIVQPLQIVTNEDMNSIYVLDGGLTSGSHSTARILEFDKSGNYVSQFAFPGEYLQVRSFDIDPDAKKVWILNGSDISEFDIP